MEGVEAALPPLLLMATRVDYQPGMSRENKSKSDEGCDEKDKSNLSLVFLDHKSRRSLLLACRFGESVSADPVDHTCF